MKLAAGRLAPPGPVSADALTFTLVKPAAGPRMMTWVSTVSPRALDRLMEEAVPGASVFPTLTRPGATQAGNFDGAAWTPTPLSVTVAGELVALLVTVTLPVRLCAMVGANATVNVAD